MDQFVAESRWKILCALYLYGSLLLASGVKLRRGQTEKEYSVEVNRPRGNEAGPDSGEDSLPEAGPIFRSTSSNITVAPGDRAVLKCRVDNLGTKTIVWKKSDDVHPLTIGLFTFTADSRITVDYNQRSNEWTLIIQHVRPMDEGTYQCLISSKDEHETYDIVLNVKNIQVTGTEYVEKGSSVRLVCNATGKPDPPHDVSWFKDGRMIVSDARSGVIVTKKIETKVLVSMLVIRDGKMSDAGVYECRSSTMDSSSINVHVINVPSRPQPAILQTGTMSKMTIGASLFGSTSTGSIVMGIQLHYLYQALITAISGVDYNILLYGPPVLR